MDIVIKVAIIAHAVILAVLAIGFVILIVGAIWEEFR